MIMAMARSTSTRIRTSARTMKRIASLLAALLLPLGALAQDFPSKPIKVIVPYAAGGGADILARGVGQQLGERLKQPVIGANKGGGGNTSGMRTVATAAKDGYPLGLAPPVCG